jgi:hypothetical protein
MTWIGRFDIRIETATRVDDDEPDRDDYLRDETSRRTAILAHQRGEPAGRRFRAIAGLPLPYGIEVSMDVHCVSSFHDE